MITDLIDLLAKFVIEIIGVVGYLGIFLLMFVESAGIPMPSEVIMPFSGFLVAAGKMGLWPVVLMGTLGNLFGSLFAYWIGDRGGRPLIEKYGRFVLISKHDLDLADRWFLKYGNLTVFFGRILPVIRTYISFPAGIAKMKIGQFSFYTFVGALPWCYALTLAGVKMGSNWEMIREKLHNFDLLMAVVVVALIALYVWRHLKQKQNTTKDL